jgi:hypothetical protein
MSLDFAYANFKIIDTLLVAKFACKIHVCSSPMLPFIFHYKEDTHCGNW